MEVVCWPDCQHLHTLNFALHCNRRFDWTLSFCWQRLSARRMARLSRTLAFLIFLLSMSSNRTNMGLQFLLGFFLGPDAFRYWYYGDFLPNPTISK